MRRRKITPQLLLTKQGEIIETPTQEGEGKTEREARGRKSTKLSIDFLGFLCYGEVIINLPKTAKADAEERCKHHTWNRHFELQTSQLEELVSIQPHCRKKGILTLEFIDCTNAQMRWIENFFMTLCKESAPESHGDTTPNIRQSNCFGTHPPVKTINNRSMIILFLLYIHCFQANSMFRL